MTNQLNLNLSGKELKETWKDVLGYEGIYEISDLGNVKSLVRHRVIFQEDTRGGYMRVFLYNKGDKKRFWVHRLVATAFLSNPDMKKEVNHKDSNPRNNHLSNLEWCSRAENMKHCFQSGRSKVLQLTRYGADHKGAKGVRQLTKNGALVAEWGCLSDAARAVGRSTGNLGNALNGSQIHCAGYKWERIEIR